MMNFRIGLLTGFFTLFGFFAAVHAQLVFDKVNHDFEELYAHSDRFVDVKITNSGKKKEYILSVRKPMEVVYITSGQFLEPDSSIILRFQPNPKKLGKFSYDVEIYTSDKQTATIFKLTGNVKEFEENSLSALQACPDFNSRPSASATEFKLTVVTIDKDSKKTLSNSTVSMLQNGSPLGSWKTNKSGQIIERVPLGYTYFYGTHEGYLPSEFGTYINFKRNYVVVELEKDPQYGVPPPVKEPVAVKDSIVPEKDTQSVVIEIPANPEVQEPQIAQPIEVLLENEPPTPPGEPVAVEYGKLPFENFEEQYFKPVNVVFVLDISSSMSQPEKLELMKYSLFQLNSYLRPQDKMAIVTYASTAKVLIPPTSGSDKESLKKPISRLKPYGGTAGGAGIKLGFDQAVLGYINNGANMVIVITDGAFNKNSEDYQKSIEAHRAKGITLSVVGIKNTAKDELKMKEAASLGNGRYVPVFKLADAQKNLIQEIRIASFRK